MDALSLKFARDPEQNSRGHAREFRRDSHPRLLRRISASIIISRTASPGSILLNWLHNDLYKTGERVRACERKREKAREDGGEKERKTDIVERSRGRGGKA